MKWSWRIARVSGIDIYLHGTFLVLLAWVAVSHLIQGHGVTDAMAGLLFVSTLFGIVVLHELGHAITAQRFGIRTRDITLLPIGGVARLERMPEKPWQELLVALAGPAVNVVLAGLLFLALAPIEGAAAVNDVALVGGRFLAKLVWVNVGLAVFNLLPAFPMDGGRALRAMLAMRMDYVQATQVAASIGQGLALLLGVRRAVLQPLPCVHRALRVDRSSWGGGRRPDEVRAARDTDQPGDGDGVPDALVRRFAGARRGSRPDWLSA